MYPRDLRHEDIQALVSWARKGIAGAPPGNDESIAAAERAAEALTDDNVPKRYALIGAHCTECDSDVDPFTGRHVDGDAEDCPYEHEDVPGDSILHTLRCPGCGGEDIAEVNVGEIWDEIVAISYHSGILTLTVDQLHDMDRNGDGWICRSCQNRLEPPTDTRIDYHYF